MSPTDLEAVKLVGELLGPAGVLFLIILEMRRRTEQRDRQTHPEKHPLSDRVAQVEEDLAVIREDVAAIKKQVQPTPEAEELWATLAETLEALQAQHRGDQ